MALETRGNREYFYLSQRHGDRVKKTYVAGGVAGQLAAEQHAEMVRERRLIRAQERVLLSRLSDIEQDVKRAHRRVETVARLHLVASGFYRHAGSEWRRRRC
jgi:hypothetical protein